MRKYYCYVIDYSVNMTVGDCVNMRTNELIFFISFIVVLSRFNTQNQTINIVTELTIKILRFLSESI